MSVKPKNVMIVEDEVITQRYLKDVLAEQNISVSIAVDNGEDALKHLESTSCDLVLMDINIKGAMDGLRLAKRILKKYRVCIIFITAYSDEGTLEEAAELSPYGFIIKPFNPHDINATIKIGYNRFILYKSNRYKNRVKNKNITITENLIYNSEKVTLLDDGVPVNLSIRQLKLIGILAKSINNVISNEAIIMEVWGDKKTSDTSLRTLVYGIRQILPSLPLFTYSKMGYMLKCDQTFDEFSQLSQ